MTSDCSRVTSFFESTNPGVVQRVELPELKGAGVALYVRREELVHTSVSGNKFHKLKYNFLEACKQRIDTVLTFGGAYSNHIHATAALGQLLGVKTIGVIRGEELDGDNPTLHFARTAGMHLHFVSRSDYRLKDDPVFVKELRERFGDFFLVPEGGSNEHAVRGCKELGASIAQQLPQMNYLCAAVGTGGTLAGLIQGVSKNTEVIGFPALKAAGYLEKEIQTLLEGHYANWRLYADYHFGGYARINKDLVLFMQRFFETTGMTLEPLYTGKLFYGLVDLIKRGRFPEGSVVCALHSGGLQGLDGMREKMNRMLEVV